MMREITSGCGMAGSIAAKSRITSLLECVISAKLEYLPVAISGLMLMDISFFSSIVCKFLTKLATKLWYSKYLE